MYSRNSSLLRTKLINNCASSLQISIKMNEVSHVSCKRKIQIFVIPLFKKGDRSDHSRGVSIPSDGVCLMDEGVSCVQVKYC